MVKEEKVKQLEEKIKGLENQFFLTSPILEKKTEASEELSRFFENLPKKRVSFSKKTQKETSQSKITEIKRGECSLENYKYGCFKYKQ